MTEKIAWADFAEKIADYTGLEKDDIRPEMNVYYDLGMDSLGLFSLGMYLTKTYEVNLPLSAVAAIETLESIIVLMNRQIGTPA
ncbi:MAG TPA: acyl carrier protein [Anaerolineae bacterium]|nr:acyl carrier protein [Anaerolineae bacterium]